MWTSVEKFIKAIQQQPWAGQCNVTEDFLTHMVKWIKEEVFPDFLAEVARQVDSIVEIDPDLSERQILARATRYMVEFLGAISASVRIYDPDTGQMLSYGSYPSQEKQRETFIPLENSVAGEVIKTNSPYLVADIEKEGLYQDKSVIQRKGAHSLMAIPFIIPRFFPHERDTVGVIQVYYPETNRNFTPLEVQSAELMARRLSFAVARKKILALYRVNEKKEAIVRKMFLKMGRREGVKMRDIFNRVVPELADIINVQSCALFSVSEDMEQVVLEAGYPDYAGYHGIGKSFAVASEPAFELILSRRVYGEESPYEVVTPSYVLVKEPEKSELISRSLKQFAAAHNINSILYVSLNVGEEVTHFMTFDALDQRKSYTEEEIEIFLFLGRELMKAQRMERLDDILHDFKNPAIATAGFARRLKSIFEKGDLKRDDPTVKRYVDILLEETSRLQEMALSLYEVGKEQALDLTQVLRNRFDINKEAIRELLRQNITVREGPFEDPLPVRCYPIHLERILDNLLNNATNAIPIQGGFLSVRTYIDGKWACAEITNTGLISEEERLRLLEGEGRGRGLYITHRIIGLIKGKIDIRLGKDTTTLIVRLPVEPAQKSPVI
ncbi:MAG: GAF domain-containing sensor histidine kinase [Deltaproteobacteria bacterium]|nr:GAF domain-containing sensor histidine kinase [Deltaproteobacteria bacterium]